MQQRNGGRRKLQVAFLGGSTDSAIGQVHRIAIEMDQRYELVAGCFSRKSEPNLRTADAYGVAHDRVYGSLDDMLAAERARLDAILVLTPTDQHRDQVLACIASGVPVICEKALAASSADARQIKAALDKNSGFLAVTYNYTGYPMLRELRHLIEQGRFGAISQIHVEMPQEGFARLDARGNRPSPQDWRLRDGRSIPTVSLDLGTHVHSLTKFLTGESPRELVAIQDSFGHFDQVADNVLCIARYSGELTSNVWYGKSALGFRNGLRLRLFGRNGAAEWHQEHPEYLHLADVAGHKSTLDRGSGEATVANQARYTRFKVGHPAGFIEAFANYYTDVADALEAYHRDNGAPFPPYVFGIDAALEGLNMLEAITSSSTKKSWVSVST
ncbi:Gfo/Idh/MocA family oxidoreductase [Bradyrhizobium sp. U87765 SZCCT0131]|uniref:Gfo/Idh/MocA family protein n=1 Tax=unclassified Bradyrhizobium TaxID=2631580 RepID=UPI001BA7E57C|nr:MULTISPECIES: Gfo/Idh/MocA family oxidoreductase [unclassified Bradyrhizobium]MBR1219660.1 Gfo/Idh/MocA family oxidoreductase [Bradyrhizobium sp. U87765 SZCCT0131]MBR1262311.1 Gfo/Idh/MocA family oxidoreductase [Bradyrhizobium sp. U87765 SZCCT0134]MBR1308506.1 Gfo/Idh/MocA family oxidoreductase [Bradyrhizobium sp. U87765 SZCCT0110]MBR1318093.1 Gfo/Idh/MocA family oxidoreductase [Bradyrhizobium sp. U87765 SZCCT0109]MBR1351796.1 Gfo/Idh/MocA family oxidoreductase [Bradyrhizobium sp. U87765 SZ